nr:hypothetical protein CFP56_79404 [Quercus suber]
MYLRLGQIWVKWAPMEAKPLQMVGLVVAKVGVAPMKVQLEGGPGGMWLGGYDWLGVWQSLDLARSGG